MNDSKLNSDVPENGPQETAAGELRRLLQTAGISFSAGQAESRAANDQNSRSQDVLASALQAVRQMTDQNRQMQQQIESLNTALTNSSEELALLHRVNDHMKAAENPETALAELVKDLKDGVDAELVLLLHPADEESGSGIIELAAAGARQLPQKTLEIIWDRTHQQRELPGGFLAYRHTIGAGRYYWPDNILSLVAVPLQGRGDRLGVLAAVNKNAKQEFNSADTQILLSTANQIAVFLSNSRLYHDLEELLLGALRALTSSIDAKDAYTCGHSERVALISRRLAHWLGFDKNQVNTVHLTGLLHDVGKIGVSEQVLTKPGRLADDEFDQIKKHPRIGANILKGIKQMATVARGVLTHHERYDGRGYPDGITGRSIPPAGRIVMLADSFDAMISDRTYRKAMPLRAALAEIRRFSGTQFDPDLADALLGRHPADLLEELKAIHDDHQPPPKLYHTDLSG